MAYERIEGTLGPLRADRQAALVAMVIANANRGPNQKAFTIDDFLLNWDPQPQDPADQRQLFGALTDIPVDGDRSS